MATNGTWVTPEGVVVKYADYWVKGNQSKSGAIKTFGNTREVEVDILLTDLVDGTVNFDIDRDNDGTLDGFSPNNALIPANATIISAEVFTEVAAAGGTDIVVGLFQADGTAVDANGLVTATEGVLANMSSAGEKITGAGALIGLGTGAADSHIGVTPNGTFTSGKVRVIVTYAVNA